jgi:hypothetical protein
MEVPAHHVENLRQNRIANGLENLVAVFAVGQNLPASQYRQVPEGIRLLHGKLPLDIPRRKFPVAQHLNDGDSCGMREHGRRQPFMSAAAPAYHKNIRQP